ncbi:MAG: hypothetical protein LUD17_10175 [Bacteroidales bacterium]|nr:hypothetical protein [Bacteroidales bacterium]
MKRFTIILTTVLSLLIISPICSYGSSFLSISVGTDGVNITTSIGTPDPGQPTPKPEPKPNHKPEPKHHNDKHQPTPKQDYKPGNQPGNNNPQPGSTHPSPTRK